MKKYDHKKIESKWQRHWEKEKLYQVSDTVKGKENFYTLVEFPYPSGNLHVGHWYAFAVPDIFVRMKRMQGLNVLFPIGFDAFGLPAENAAIQRGINPRRWTYDNIAYMRRQLHTMGTAFDWSREVITCDPKYYKWTQWIFLQFFKKGLAYQAETNVNWCPKDKTVLANEQVVNGRCERCESIVEQRKMKQWLLRITDYAEKLLQGLEKLDWPEEIKESQRNWIGKSEGAEVEFPISNSQFSNFVLLHGFTGRADKNFLPWLKKSLEQRGFEVQAPQMPNPDDPSQEEQVNHVLRNCTIDENTVVVGHSLGGVVAMQVLQKINKPIAGLVLVAPAVDPKHPGAEERPFWKNFNWNFDYERVMSLTSFRLVLSDLKEKEKRHAYLEHLSKQLAASLITGYAERKHFTNNEEPLVLENLVSTSPQPSPRQERGGVTVFTTRPDTIFGATYLVLAPEHPLVSKMLAGTPSSNSSPLEGEEGWGGIQNPKEVKAYIEKAARKTGLQRTALEKEKTGVELKGIRAINPATKEQIPVWVADYVMMSYGTGAIMAVPAHDERDYIFAKKYKLPIRKVIEPPRVVNFPEQPPGPAAWGHLNHMDLKAECWTGDGTMVNSGEFNGRQSNEVRWQMAEFVGGRKAVQYKIRDWVISRQRYWGVPIPVIHCKTCGVQPVPEKALPVLLPDIKDYKPRDDGKSPLSKVEQWVRVKCPACGQDAERETDTMDTFVDSSWYFLRYTDPHNQKAFASQTQLRKWLPVKMYSGGAEHTTMHLLYSRFWIKAMHDLGMVEWNEPYVRRLNRGLILGPDGQKMSKSRGNVVDPDNYVRELGADTVRLYLAFIGPYNVAGAYPWDPKGIMGVRRFLEKVWRVFDSIRGPSTSSGTKLFPERSDSGVEGLLHKTIEKVTADIKNFRFNTAISAMMILVNELGGLQTAVSKKQLEIFLKILAPFAPHLAEELWQKLGYEKSIHLEEWPKYDKNLVKEEKVRLAVQVNGKLRATIEIEADASEEQARKLAESNPNVQKYLQGEEVKKVVYVKGKIINFVI